MRLLCKGNTVARKKRTQPVAEREKVSMFNSVDKLRMKLSKFGLDVVDNTTIDLEGLAQNFDGDRRI